MRKYIWLNTVFIIALAVLLVVSALHIATVLREEGADDYYYGLQDSIVSEQTPEETTEPISSEATTPHGPHIRRSISFASAVYRCGRVALL